MPDSGLQDPMIRQKQFRVTRFLSHMALALQNAREAGSRGETPVGAVVIGPGGRVLAGAGNRTRELSDPTAHAEILAIRQACLTLGTQRLAGCDLYVTLEPCAMCAGAIAAARVARIYYGASDPKSGGVESGAQVFARRQSHHCPEIFPGISEPECAALLTGFFEGLRR